MSFNADLSGKVALVTGASSGIGRAIAIGLGRSRARVVVNYRTNEAGANQTVEAIAAAGTRAWAHRADVSDPQAASELVARILAQEGRLDILVNNAGDPVEARGLEELTPEIWDRVMAVNLRCVFLCAQAAVPSMKKLGWGRIINITSIAAVTGGSPGTLPYAAAKGGVETFTRGLARVLGPYGITVNAVAPGSIRTGMQEKFASPHYIESKIAEAPLGRCGTPEEVAAAVLFLVSDAGAFITGQVVRVDGGRSA